MSESESFGLVLVNEIGWTRTYNFENGIKETIDWYLNNQDWIEDIKTGEYQKVYINK